MTPKQHKITVDTDRLLKVIGTVEWFVETRRLTYDEALAILHAAVNDSVTNGNVERSNDDCSDTLGHADCD